MLKSDLYRALRTELHRHDFSTFVDEPPSIAQGGRGVVVIGVSDLQKEIWNDAAVLGSPHGRCVASGAGPTVKFQI